MKKLILSLLVIFATSLAFSDEGDKEGVYEDGLCAKDNVVKNEELKIRLIEKLPFSLGGKFQLGCCVSHVESACSQSFEDMKRSNEQQINSEKWAVCFRSVVLQNGLTDKRKLRGTAQEESNNECPSRACRVWAEDCMEAKLERIRSAIKERDQ